MNQNALMKNMLLTLALCLSFLGQSSARAVLLTYDGFDYTAGANLAGFNGGAGWNGAWVDVGGAGGISVASGNLTAGAHAPAGYDARSTGNSAFVSNANRIGRWLDCSANGTFGTHGLINANGHIGANGSTVYISFLQQPNSAASFYEFELKRDDLGDPGRIGGVGDDTANNGGEDNHVHWRSEVPAGGTSTFWNLGPGDTGVDFYVVRIDYLNGNDNVYVYRNPTSNTEPATPTMAVIGAGDMSFNGVSMAAYDNGLTLGGDQIRMGVAWADVIGGPPGFIVQPAQQTTAVVNGVASLSAVVASDLPVNYQWYFTNSLVVGATNSTLTLSNVQTSATGTYYVTASNSLGSTTSIVASVTVQLHPIPVMRILPVGDSITCGVSSPANIPGGYRTLLASLLNNFGYNVTFTGLLNVNNPPGVTAWHEGHSGAEIAGVDYCMQGVFDSTDDPDIILLLLGTNDYNNGIGAGATNRLDQMITHLATNRPNAKIIVANLLLRTDNATLNSQITSTFNPFIPGIVAAHAALGQQVYFTDLRSAVTSAGLSSDGIHPNASGYACMATNWFNAITNVIGLFGTTNAPVISHVVSLGGLTNVAVTFSKPVADMATNLANFTLNGGATITGAALDAATKRVVTLTTSPLTQNTSYTLTVSNAVDLTAAQTPIAGGTMATFNACGAHGATNNVAEASHFHLAYSLDIPNAPNYSGGITYTVDNHAGLGAFGRVAYYLELQATNDGSVQFVWVSMNPFTTNLTKIGVPKLASGAVFQQNVTNMNVVSSVAGIVTGTNLNGGNLEFWPYNYAQTNSLSVSNASSGVYDWGDQNSGNGNFGSMQIANHNSSQMFLSFNAWGGYGGNADLGIGNNTVYQTGNWNVIDNFTDIQLDWTFRANAASYAVKTLQVFIQPVPVPGTTNLVAVLGNSTTLATSNLIALAGNPANYPLSITAVNATSTNGSTVSLSNGSITYTPVAIGPDQFTYTLSDGHGGTAIGNITVVNVANGIGGWVSGIAFTNGVATMTFTGIPGYQYHVQVSTNLSSWADVSITNAPAGGAFQFSDNAAPIQDAYYRLMWNGN
jgi:lysophospholipase L1-like esterase